MKFTFKHDKRSRVSIVTLLYNKSELTRNFLKSLQDNVSVPFELILLDNASTDDTNKLLDEIEGAIIIKSNYNFHFIRGNNLASYGATSEYLLFLNNDIVVHKGCIESMLETMQRDEKCFGVASKIIFPTGELQEAGSIIWTEGNCYGYGRGMSPLLPEFNYKREVDYGSAACLMVKRADFERLNKFDEIFNPAYYEDTDLCMKLRNAGGKIIYDPNAVITHHEYSSSSPESAIQKMQERQMIFEKKWHDRLQENYPADLIHVLDARDIRKVPKLLYIDDRIPTPDEGAGYPRAFAILEALVENFKITVFPKQDIEARQPWTKKLENMGIECIYDGRTFEHFMTERKDFYDIVFVSRPHNMLQSIDEINKNFPNAKVVYDAEALYYERERMKHELFITEKDNKNNIPPFLEYIWKERKDLQEYCSIDSEEGQIKLLEWWKLYGVEEYRNKVVFLSDEYFLQEKKKELSLINRADEIIFVSNRELDILLKAKESMPVPSLRNMHVYGYGVECKPIEKSFTERIDILFVGAFHGTNTPNEDAVRYFINTIFPIIRKKIGCRLLIAGKHAEKILANFSVEGVEVLGFVENLDELYANSRVFIAPHRYAAGIPLKVIESLSKGLPTVVSKLIAKQFSFESDNELLIGDSAESYANKVIELYTNEILWEQTRKAGLQYIKNNHNKELMNKNLNAIITNLKK